MEQPVYTVETLLDDPEFRAWVSSPTPDSDTYWLEFARQYPTAPVAQARKLLQLIEQHVESGFPADEQIERMRAGITSHIQESEIVVRPLWSSVRRWAAAASAVLVIGISGWFYLNRTPDGTLYQQLTAQVDTPLQERVNTGTQPMLVTLPDGSTVALQPNSRVSYNPSTAERRREVYLTGEALFDVVKNPQRPFLVYANELVTKVLGTSFWVKALEKETNVIVSVRTGRVAVFNRTDSKASQLRKNPELSGIVLMPNQQLVFNRIDARMQKTRINEPEWVESTAKAPAPAFVYQDQPVSQVFDELEEAFGIDIVYDKALMQNCLLTASLTDESLHEKLRLICKSIQAQYQVQGQQILITGPGCN